jgi:ATP-binding cassette, subfamily D (ALD), peroxisomal long-chain fatty acid import protein
VVGTGDNGDEWEWERIGTEREKMQVERELQELHERLAQVDEWKSRRDEIEQELAQVWTDSSTDAPLEPPSYIAEKTGQDADAAEVASV